MTMANKNNHDYGVIGDCDKSLISLSNSLQGITEKAQKAKEISVQQIQNYISDSLTNMNGINNEYNKRVGIRVPLNTSVSAWAYAPSILQTLDLMFAACPTKVKSYIVQQSAFEVQNFIRLCQDHMKSAFNKHVVFACEQDSNLFFSIWIQSLSLFGPDADKMVFSSQEYAKMKDEKVIDCTDQVIQSSTYALSRWGVGLEDKVICKPYMVVVKQQKKKDEQLQEQAKQEQARIEQEKQQQVIIKKVENNGQGTIKELQDVFADANLDDLKQREDDRKQVEQGTIGDLQNVFADVEPNQLDLPKPIAKKVIAKYDFNLKDVQFNPKQVIDLLSVPIYNSITCGEYIETEQM